MIKRFFSVACTFLFLFTIYYEAGQLEECKNQSLAADEEEYYVAATYSGGVQKYLKYDRTEWIPKEYDTSVTSEVEAENDKEIVNETISVTVAEKVTDAKGIAEDTEPGEYEDLAIADVNDYVNVRSGPDTDSAIVGKIYDGAVAHIIQTAGEENDWFQIVSGNVEGYIKAEYFISGKAAAEVVEQYITRYACVIADRLNVRENPDKEARKIDSVLQGEKMEMVEDLGDWIKVECDSQKTGYVASEYVTLSEEFVYAKTLEEERKEEEERKAREEQKRREEQTNEDVSAESAPVVVTPAASYANTEELRSSIVDYAMQFLGNKYVHGGNSLTTGTDCSGFTSLIYAEFGYSLSRTPGGQFSGNGRSISYDEIKPGDVICYGKGSKCTHVALYIGNGQIIHEANSKKGVVIYEADYDTIIGIKNIID